MAGDRSRFNLKEGIMKLTSTLAALLLLAACSQHSRKSEASKKVTYLRLSPDGEGIDTFYNMEDLTRPSDPNAKVYCFTNDVKSAWPVRADGMCHMEDNPKGIPATITTTNTGSLGFDDFVRTGSIIGEPNIRGTWLNTTGPGCIQENGSTRVFCLTESKTLEVWRLEDDPKGKQ